MDSAQDLLVLNVGQPWAWTVSCLGADTVSIGSKPGLPVVGRLLAVASGSDNRYGSRAGQWIREVFGIHVEDGLPWRSIVAVGRVRAVEYVGETRGPVQGDEWGWGPWCLRLEQVLAIEPVFRGAPTFIPRVRDFFVLRPKVQEQVLANLQHAQVLAAQRAPEPDWLNHAERAQHSLWRARKERPALYRGAVRKRLEDGRLVAMGADGRPRLHACSRWMVECPECGQPFCEAPSHNGTGLCEEPGHAPEGEKRR